MVNRLSCKPNVVGHQGPVSLTLGFLLLLALWSLTSLVTAQESLQAQIGIEIKSGERVTWAMADDRAHVGDFLRIHVVPVQPSYVYVVYTDGQEVTLLNTQGLQSQLHPGNRLLLPGTDEFYQIRPGSTTERFTIICSRKILQDLLDIPAHGLSPKAWSVLEEKYRKAGEIALGSDIGKPVPVAGNTRSLRHFSGTSLLVRTYAFHITP